MSAAAKKRDPIEQILDGEGETPPWAKSEADAEVIDALPEGERQDGVVSEVMAEGQMGLVTTVEEPTHGMIGGRVYQEDMDFTAEEIGTPYLRIASSQSKAVTDGPAEVGQWLLPNFDPMDTVDVVVLGVSRYREYRDIEMQETICKSDDGKFAVPGMTYSRGSAENPSGACENCPMSKWGAKRANGKSKPPLCNNGFSYMCYVPDHETIAVLDLKKTGLDAAEKLNNQLKVRRAKGFVATLGHSMESSPVGGKYPKVQVSTRPITAEERKAVDLALS